jgi:hypothetical protein
MNMDWYGITQSMYVKVSYCLYLRRYFFFFYCLDPNKHQPEPDLDGTYAAAWNDPSIDYLAIVLSGASKSLSRIIIGNKIPCESESISSIPCNGKLKPNKNYT